VELSLSYLVLTQPPTFTRLRRLRLVHASCINNDFATVTFFLHKAPLLEVLYLDHAFTPSQIYAPNIYRLNQILRALSDTPRISLPHLRVLSLDDVPLIILELLRLLPDPSHSLSLRASECLHIPESQNAGSPRGAQRVFEHLKRFWSAKSGLDANTLPSGRLHVDNRPFVSFGLWPTPSTLSSTGVGSTSSPSVFYASTCEVTGPDPIFEHMRSIELVLSKAFQRDEAIAVDALKVRLQALDHLPGLGSEEVPLNVSITGSLSEGIQRKFKSWLERKREAGSSIETINIPNSVGASRGTETWAMDLVESGLIRSITWG
jgi:hypothetical protein